MPFLCLKLISGCPLPSKDLGPLLSNDAPVSLGLTHTLPHSRLNLAHSAVCYSMPLFFSRLPGKHTLSSELSCSTAPQGSLGRPCQVQRAPHASRPPLLHRLPIALPLFLCILSATLHCQETFICRPREPNKKHLPGTWAGTPGSASCHAL